MPVIVFLTALVKINLFGDLMPANWVEDIMSRNPDSVFVNIDSVLSDADFNIVNLESPATDTGEIFPDKRFIYKFPPEFIKIFKRHNINVFLLANNHMLDFGAEGMFSTIKAIKESKLFFAGAGKNLKDASRGIILEKNGIKIGVLNFAMTFPLEFYAKKNKPGIAPGYPGNVIPEVRRMRKKVDFLIVAFHFGAEKMDTPKDYQIEMAKKCIDNGADLVYGHHPHRVQPLEIYKNKLIAYSLGNFIFGSYSRSVNGAFISLTLESDSVYYKIYPLNVDPIETGFATSIKNDSLLISHLILRCRGCRANYRQGFVKVTLPK